MSRRQFLAGVTAAFTWPIFVFAQDALKKPRRIGFVGGGSSSTPALKEFIRGMRDLGYVEGTHFVMEWRLADGAYDRFGEFGEELARIKVDVIVLATPAAIRPLQTATKTIPIVMGISNDPVGNGFVASLSHPGSNVTGLAASLDETVSKQLEFLSSVVPNLRRIGVLTNPRNATMYPSDIVDSLARDKSITLVRANAQSDEEIEGAFSKFKVANAQAVMFSADAVLLKYREQLAARCMEARLPSMFPQREYVASGGLMSYGESLGEFLYRSASFVDRIFRGAKPQDLPIEQPTRFHLIINRKTADALDVSIPSSLYAFAEEVIE